MPESTNTTDLELSALETHVLLVLVEEGLHGYAIAKAIEKREGPKIYPANLYRHLNRLAARGLIESHGAELDAKGRARKRFTIAALGLEAVRAEGRRLKTLLEELEQKDLVSPQPSMK